MKQNISEQQVDKIKDLLSKSKRWFVSIEIEDNYDPAVLVNTITILIEGTEYKIYPDGKTIKRKWEET